MYQSLGIHQDEALDLGEVIEGLKQADVIDGHIIPYIVTHIHIILLNYTFTPIDDVASSYGNTDGNGNKLLIKTQVFMEKKKIEKVLKLFKIPNGISKWCTSLYGISKSIN